MGGLNRRRTRRHGSRRSQPAAELASDGSLFDGHHPRMREVHERNADRLAQIIEQIGWPSPSTAGADAARTAFLRSVQHAISRPAFMRSCLPLLESAAQIAEVPQIEVAMLTDRMRVLSGKPQIYGTQFDWDEGGQMSPHQIKNIERADQLRKAAGMETLEENITRIRRRIGASEKPPANWKEQQQQADEFATLSAGGINHLHLVRFKSNTEVWSLPSCAKTHSSV